MSSRFETSQLQQPKVIQPFIPAGKFIAIDETKYNVNPLQPERQVVYGSGVSSDFKPINFGNQNFLNSTNLLNPNPIVNYGSFIYQKRTGFQGQQSRDMSRLYI